MMTNMYLAYGAIELNFQKKKLKFATIFIVRSKKKSKTNVKCLLISK